MTMVAHTCHITLGESMGIVDRPGDVTVKFNVSPVYPGALNGCMLCGGIEVD